MTLSAGLFPADNRVRIKERNSHYGMERLDQSYLRDLVIRAGSSANAFAELYSATSPRQFAYLSYMLGDEAKAISALKEVYIFALNHLASLSDPDLFLPWLSRASYRKCHELTGNTDVSDYNELNISQILNLPLSESQVLLMKYIQNLSEDEISDILNLSVRMIRKLIKAGLKHLGTNAVTRGISRFSGNRARGRLSAAQSAEVLSGVFDETGVRPNTIPLEALASYAVYRKERFSLQRTVLSIFVALFLILPVLFILPVFDITGPEAGIRGLPVYTVKIRSLLPVDKVTARLRTHNLPVYEQDAGIYQIEPTRNGELSLTVSLVNQQEKSEICTVEGVDSVSPVLKDSEIRKDSILLMVYDSGIGVSYYDIYAEDESGRIHKPLSFNEKTGEVLFEYPDENWDVYIPDYIGNLLHLALTFQ